MVASNPEHSQVITWNRLTCDAIYYAKLPPTIAARVLAMVHTAMYDAWTAYNDGPEISTTTGDLYKQPAADCTYQNREKAYSYAAYRVLKALFEGRLPEDNDGMFEACMQELGYKKISSSCEPKSPGGIGNLAGQLVLDCRRCDGSNEENDYADYTDYCPVNPPPPQRVKCVDRWQPQLVSDKTPQEFMTPHWGLVKPFALEWGGQFRPPAPVPASNEWAFSHQLKHIKHISACLDDEQKLIAEYWAGMHEDKFEDAMTIEDWGYWTVPPAQCCRIARFIAVKNEFQNSNAIKLFFALTNALLDASIAAWDSKRHYDYCRPDSAIHELDDDNTIRSWGGPCRGTVEMEGEGWCPYLLGSPPFAEYVSGHSTFSRAMADIIEYFCGADAYGEEVTFSACSSVIEPKCTPAEEVTFCWGTLRQAADEAGMSRRYGGIHFKDGDLNGRELGSCVAHCVWEKVKMYLDGVST